MEPTSLHALWGQTLDGFTLDKTQHGSEPNPSRTFKAPEGQDTTAPVELQAMALTVTWAPDLEMPQQQASEAGTGEYHLVEELGRGGMAVVYKAQQTRLQRPVAMKLANEGIHSQRRFVAEARVTGVLDHPNIVPVHDLVRTDDGGLALAMRLVDGQSWEDKLEARQDEEPWFLEDHVHALIAVAHAVEFAHRRGVLHCDLKPENVMIGKYGEVVLMDWGCALAINEEAAAIVPRARKLVNPMGTPLYMSPELAKAESDKIGVQTDVYLLGATLHRVLTGRAPHQGETFFDVVYAACTGATLALDDAEPPDLAEIARKAMALEPEDRYQTARAFRRALEMWLRTHESEHLARQARRQLAECETQLGALDAADNRSDLYLAFEEALSGLSQAQSLWEGNTKAAEDAHRARLLIAQSAIDAGDLHYAEAHLKRLDAGADQDQLLQRLREATAARAQAKQRYRRTRWALVGALALVVLTTSIGFAVSAYEANLAQEAEAVAVARLAEIERLSDVEILQDLQERAAELYPALPDQVEPLQKWLDEADQLLGHLPGHRAHLQALAKQASEDADGKVAFTSHTVQWEHDTMQGLVEGLEQLQAKTRPDVERRLGVASTIAQRSLTDHSEAWDQVQRSVREDSRFAGLTLTPQIGLVPLGADPSTGLQEFAHLATGTAPVRDAAGQLQLEEAHGVVLVLIPGGSFYMGAEPGPAGDNRDPSAHEHEGPVNPVALKPFFAAKHEVTQAQWERVMGANPAAYPPGKEVGGNMHTALHPVEQVRWSESMEFGRRVDLTLPTEAQWEYAARAGTRTVFWTGNDPKSLQGATNIADLYGKTHDGPESWHWEDFLNDGYLTHAPVGRFRANGFGLHDTAGNVWEWCLDRFGEYTAPTDPSNGARETGEDAARVFRGGGFRASTVHARSADRYSLYAADYRAYDVGLRAARDIDQEP